MSRGSWRTIIKVAGLTVLAFAAVSLFSSLTWHSTALENEASNRSNIHRQNAHDRIEWVCPTAISQPDCIDETNQAARENEREEQDLAAQKITAWWTKVMGIAALIGMGLSAAGVWLIKTTFDEARRGNEIALAAASFEFGAEIRIRSGRLTLDHDAIILDMEIINTGKIIAHGIRVNATLSATDNYNQRPYEIYEQKSSARVSSLLPITSNEDTSEPVNLVWFGSEKFPYNKIRGFFETGEAALVSIDVEMRWETDVRPDSAIGARMWIFDIDVEKDLFGSTIVHNIDRIDHHRIGVGA